LARPSAVLHDPYFNIVEVTIYGQARFYNPPPEEPEAESSAEGGATPDVEATPADAAKADTTRNVSGEANGTSSGSAASTDEAVKQEPPTPEAKSDPTPGKADAEAPR